MDSRYYLESCFGGVCSRVGNENGYETREAAEKAGLAIVIEVEKSAFCSETEGCGAFTDENGDFISPATEGVEDSIYIVDPKGNRTMVLLFGPTNK